MENLIAMTSIVSLWLLQLRNVSRVAGDRLATSVYPIGLIRLLIAVVCLNTEAEQMRLREFYHSLASLGGFLRRKGDGDPGWQTLWLGWKRLKDMYDGARILNNST